MRGSDRTILVVIPLLALAVGFWLLVVSPKRTETAELQDRIDALQSSIAAAETQAASAEAARERFPVNYSEMVTLGRAVPEDSDQATFIYDMAGLGKRNDVEFRAFTVTAGSGEAPAPPPAPTTPAPKAEEPGEGEGDGEDGEAPADEGSTATPVAAPVATEAVAAALPLGATIGPAGLPVVPYEFRFLGSFFDMASFFHDIDRSVVVSDKDGEPSVNGRLVTIDSFELTGDPDTGFPDVEANFAVTTYVVPAEQGLQAGATPAGPAPVGSPAAPTPVSSAGATP